jgi:hypothetical protein
LTVRLVGLIRAATSLWPQRGQSYPIVGHGCLTVPDSVFGVLRADRILLHRKINNSDALPLQRNDD